MSVLTRTVLLLVVSNLFMLTAWYLHLKTLNHKPWYIASLVSWGIAFFEYRPHSGQPDWSHHADTFPVADSPGWYVPAYFCAVLHFRDGASDKNGLYLGGILPHWRCVLYFSWHRLDDV
jgi:hypothetical protein